MRRLAGRLGQERPTAGVFRAELPPRRRRATGLFRIAGFTYWAQSSHMRPKISEIVDAAEQLLLHPPVDTEEPPPLPVHDWREALSAIVDRIGIPTLYGGGAAGPNIRWRLPQHTVLLHPGDVGLILSCHTTEVLETAERDAFGRGVGDDKGQVPRYSDLPYLWQVARNGIGTLPPSFPAPPLAPDWDRLEESIRSLCHAWATQLTPQVNDWAGYNVVNHADGGRVLAVLYGADDGLTIYIDDRDGSGSGDHAVTMRHRGWDSRVPLLQWWDAYFAADADGAEAAAKLVVKEVRARGARMPGDLGVTDVNCGDNGQLMLPGLGIAPED
ncbi:hypothetical protein OHA98_15995 [Streptomyces sp. NBC_00654]|uniref:hypothetical protein n=1 Tax=Streptomyces sp. NBC_00654 TaxID=2975799 RepID=UPI00225BBF21|nr:hypothetical protein [Streptomyces sp. NBC_00654]MCX4966313.1 hypothetical protein [Streptomyces sp. NBC_00654]